MAPAREKLRLEQDVVVDAPLEAVWTYLMDISKIPEFHPRVSSVDLISGTADRSPGVDYQCNITEGRGKGTCVERIEEVVPFERFVTSIPEDSWGISKMFPNYVVDTRVDAVGAGQTRVSMRQYFATPGLKGRLVFLVARRKFARQTADTLAAIKRAVERERAASDS